MNKENWDSNLDAAADNAIAAYVGLVAASDALAEAMSFSSEKTLRNMLPKNSGGRRSIDHIKFFVSMNRDDAFKYACEEEEKAQSTAARKELVARLKLTPDDLNLLGVKLE